MPKIRQYPQVFIPDATDAFIIDRLGEGTFYIEYSNLTIGGSGGTVTSVNASGGTTGLTFTGGPITTNGTLTLGGTLAIANGGTGTATPSLVAGTNVSISGTWPNQTINATGGGGGSGTVTSVDVSGGTTGLTFTGGPVTTSGTITAGGTLAVANGGTGTATPSLVAGTNVTISGSWPNQTVNASGGGGSAVTINPQTGTSYTLVLSDAQNMITMNNASPNTLTIPLNASVAFPTGTTVAIQQIGAGMTTIAATGGVTLNYLSTLTLAIVGQYGVAQLIKTDIDTWTLFGAIGG